MPQDQDNKPVLPAVCICGGLPDVFGYSVKCDRCGRGVHAAGQALAVNHWNLLQGALVGAVRIAPMPSTFRTGEMVEVSDDGNKWGPRRFIGDAGPEHDRRYLCSCVFTDGTALIAAWRLCRLPNGKDGQ